MSLEAGNVKLFKSISSYKSFPSKKAATPSERTQGKIIAIS
jgi:hypothetical protein